MALTNYCAKKSFLQPIIPARFPPLFSFSLSFQFASQIAATSFASLSEHMKVFPPFYCLFEEENFFLRLFPYFFRGGKGMCVCPLPNGSVARPPPPTRIHLRLFFLLFSFSFLSSFFFRLWHTIASSAVEVSLQSGDRRRPFLPVAFYGGASVRGKQMLSVHGK